MLKSNETYLRRKQITIFSEKMLQKMKSLFREKKFEISKLQMQHLMKNSVLHIFCYKLELFGVKESLKHKHKC